MKCLVFCVLFITPAFAAAAPPSPHLDFGLDAKEIAERCGAAVKASDEKLAALVAEKDGMRTFKNTVVAFDYILSDLESETASPTFLKYVATDKAVREAGHACETKVEKYAVDVFAREDLYAALRAYAAKGDPLAGADKKLLEKTLLDFRKNGLELGPVARARYKLLKKQLIEMEGDYGKNLNDVKDFLAVTREELEGLPEDFVARLERLEGGTYKVTLDYPDYFPFMENARHEAARRRLDTLMKNRAAPENVALLEEILRLRLRLAKMLGYRTHAHYVLEERMAKDPANVAKFLKRMRKKLARKARPELKVMLSLKREDSPGAKDIMSWDFFYYSNQLMKSRYQVDNEKIKEYFPMGGVTTEMLRLYQALLGVRFKEVVPAEAWHPDVKRYQVYDAETGESRGHFYMDLYPRDGKYKHAAAFTLIGGRREEDGSYRSPVSAIVANFNKPTKERPSLLKHEEVEIYFHEFGHIMHQVLTRAGHPRFAGTRVARDFMEAPSQMLENWVWQEEILRRISGHYQTGESLPEDLLKRLLEARNLNAGLRYLRQIFYATIDQIYHDGDPEDTTAAYQRLYSKIGLIALAPETRPQAGFGHLMGYAASYYGYLWSEVYSADMFSVFNREGILDKELGMRYRKTILEPGGGADEGEMVRRFLGREPNEEAFLESIGLN